MAPTAAAGNGWRAGGASSSQLGAGAGGARTGGAAERGGAPAGPQVDRSVPALTALEFRADQADPAAREALGLQLAFLDRAVEPRGLLIVYLHGAGEREVC